VLRHGDSVDPYFAAKALLAAQEAGLDVRKAAKDWIRWVLPFQRPDGGFDRFCLKEKGFLPCNPADADDATAAVWIDCWCDSHHFRGCLQSGGQV